MCRSGSLKPESRIPQEEEQRDLFISAFCQTLSRLAKYGKVIAEMKSSVL